MNTVIKRAWNKNKMVKVEDLTGMTFQAESGGHTFEISGVDDTGAAVSLSGTVEARFLRADNAEIIISGTVSSGKASATLSAACYAIPGRFLLTVYVTSGGQKVAVYAATGSVVATSGTAGGSIPPLVTDSIIAGDATVNGVLDVTQRRCYANLSSPGWYRVMTTTFSNQSSALGGVGFIVKLDITTSFNSADNDAHSISLLAKHNHMVFAEESSIANSLSIDKVRYTYNGNVGHIDIHYTATSANAVSCSFSIASEDYVKRNTVSGSLQYVVPSPSGETVLTEYSFAANTEEDGSVTAESGVTINEIDIKRSGRIVYVHFYAAGTFAANTSYTLGTLSGVPMPTKYIRWMAGGGVNPYNATTPVYAILDYTNSKITAYASAACKAINITVSYIV